MTTFTPAKRRGGSRRMERHVLEPSLHYISPLSPKWLSHGPPRFCLLRARSRHPHPHHPVLRRPLRRRFQHLRGEHVGGSRGRGNLAERGQLSARRRESGYGGAEFRPAPARDAHTVVREIG